MEIAKFSNALFFSDTNILVRGVTSLRLHIINLLLNNVIELNGMVNEEKALQYASKSQLWVYIIYLKNDNPYIFTDVESDQDYVDFVNKTLKSVDDEFFMKSDLVRFINKIVSDNKSKIVITVLKQAIDQLMNSVQKEDENLQSKFKDFSTLFDAMNLQTNP